MQVQVSSLHDTKVGATKPRGLEFESYLHQNHIRRPARHPSSLAMQAQHNTCNCKDHIRETLVSKTLHAIQRSLGNSQRLAHRLIHATILVHSNPLSMCAGTPTLAVVAFQCAGGRQTPYSCYFQNSHFFPLGSPYPEIIPLLEKYL